MRNFHARCQFTKDTIQRSTLLWRKENHQPPLSENNLRTAPSNLWSWQAPHAHVSKSGKLMREERNTGNTCESLQSSMKHPHLRLYLHNRSATNRLRYRNRRYRWIDRTQHHARHWAVTFRKAVRILDQVVRVFGSIYVVEPEKTFWEDSRYTIFIEVGWGRSSLPWIIDTCVEFSKHLHPHICITEFISWKCCDQQTCKPNISSTPKFWCNPQFHCPECPEHHSWKSHCGSNQPPTTLYDPGWHCMA